VPAKLAKVKVAARDGKPNLEDLAGVVGQLKASEPELNTALIQPQAATLYEDIIDVMDQFKKAGVIDLGVSPL
jgi:biopolymer transport protein ExbD